jgi:orotate phosphoribosyltransferase
MTNVANSLYSSRAIIFNAKHTNGFSTPIYVDIRRTLGALFERNIIIQEMTKSLNEYYPECNLVAGVCTAGSPFAAIIAHNLNLPMCYVRQTTKDHGLGNKIEGNVEKNQKVVIVEDVIDSGKSVLNVVATLEGAEINVLGVVSIFDYGTKYCIQNFEKNKISYKSLTNFDEIMKLGLEKGIINTEDYNQLLFSRDNMPYMACRP